MMSYVPLSRVWLTFGDGPCEWTARIQDVLDANGVKAIFFMCGKRARLRPDLVRRVVGAGHRVGSHGWSHERLGGASAQRMEQEVCTSKEILEEIGGQPVAQFLAPFCNTSAALEAVVQRAGMTCLDHKAAIDPRDWEEPGVEELVARVSRAVVKGTRAERPILLHDGKADQLPVTADIQDEDRSQTVAALPAIISLLRQHGVSIDLL
ncbi:MAG TPA: polysaccharide deacetylase family protein [Polyangiaceae bacterium]|jgi:peptidoglycan/xylan/chitin deacetylase (PgdA/CDA1 family)|nr:polysaccharide deacetylase family protein [Polyangiaceae bacterium]